MNILLISCFFPPGDRIADLRAGKWAKYLIELGQRVRVLTARPISGKLKLTPQEVPDHVLTRTPIRRLSRNKSLHPAGVQGNGDIPATVSRATRFGRAVKRSLFFNDVRLPDDSLGWYPYAVSAGRNLLAQTRFDVIVSTSGPVTSHLVAHRLQRISGCPWVADYRDLWSQNYTVKLPWPLRQIDGWLERRVISRASLLTTVSEPLANALRQLHGKEVEVLTNGFDLDDYHVSDCCKSVSNAVFVLSYMGSINPRRNPALMFRAIRQLADEKVLTPDCFRLRFYGSSHEYVKMKALEMGVLEFMDLCNPVTYYESLAEQKSSSALLLVEECSPQAAGFLTGKLFEYLGAGRPILAVGYERGALRDILVETNAGIIHGTYEPLIETLRSWFMRFRRGEAFGPKPRSSIIRQYSRKAQTEKLLTLLERVVSD